MKIKSIFKANFIFLLAVLALNFLFLLQQRDVVDLESSLQHLTALKDSWGCEGFLALLTLLSLVLCLFSLPGAGLLLSVGGYAWGMKFTLVGGGILFLATALSFPFSKKAKEKSAFFRALASYNPLGERAESEVVLFFLRMNPAVPFIFVASYVKRKLDLKLSLFLLVSSYLHSCLYVLVGETLRFKTLNPLQLFGVSVVFVVISLVGLMWFAFRQRS